MVTHLAAPPLRSAPPGSHRSAVPQPSETGAQTFPRHRPSARAPDRSPVTGPTQPTQVRTYPGSAESAARAPNAKKGLRLFIALLVIPSLVACGTAAAQPNGTPSPAPASAVASAPQATEPGPTDYSQSSHWLALPTTPDKAVDVFYLSPTEYSKALPSDGIIGAVDNPAMMKGVQAAFSRQATAFETVANIYAPYYRQADAASRAALPQAEQVAIVAGAPTQDGLAAFDYYITHYNDGRPFFLAGHSLGSNVLANLLAQYMKDHPEVYKRMVAAYVVGYSITPEYLAQNPLLTFATGPTDTGVIVSWNTEALVVDGSNPVTMPGGLAINPISWTRTEAVAPAAQNLGSIALGQDGTPTVDANGNIAPVLGFADARVDTARGVVITSTVPVDQYSPGGPGRFPKGVYHTFDIPFYFFDLRANAADRAADFLGTK